MIEQLFQSLFGRKVREADADQPQQDLTVMPGSYLLPAPQNGETMANNPENEPQQVGEDVQAQLAEMQRRLAVQSAKQRITEKQREAATSRYMGGQEQYQQAGLGALEAQQALAGLLGPEAQQAAIAQLQASPQFQALAAQGEQAILSNAAATGGVRGGNTAAALAQFRPGLLSDIINQQYAQLGGLSGMGAQVGQGLVGAGISREQSEQDYLRWLQGMGLDLGVAGIQAGAQGRLGQTQLDIQRQAIEEEKKRYAQAQSDQNMATMGASALQGAGTGATIGSLFGPAGAVIGGLGGLLVGGLAGGAPTLFGRDQGV